MGTQVSSQNANQNDCSYKWTTTVWNSDDLACKIARYTGIGIALTAIVEIVIEAIKIPYNFIVSQFQSQKDSSSTMSHKATKIDESDSSKTPTWKKALKYTGYVLGAGVIVWGGYQSLLYFNVIGTPNLNVDDLTGGDKPVVLPGADGTIPKVDLSSGGEVSVGDVHVESTATDANPLAGVSSLGNEASSGGEVPAAVHGAAGTVPKVDLPSGGEGSVVGAHVAPPAADANPLPDVGLLGNDAPAGGDSHVVTDAGHKPPRVELPSMGEGVPAGSGRPVDQSSIPSGNKGPHPSSYQAGLDEEGRR